METRLNESSPLLNNVHDRSDEGVTFCIFIDSPHLPFCGFVFAACAAIAPKVVVVGASIKTHMEIVCSLIVAWMAGCMNDVWKKWSIFTTLEIISISLAVCSGFIHPRASLCLERGLLIVSISVFVYNFKTRLYILCFSYVSATYIIYMCSVAREHWG